MVLGFFPRKDGADSKQREKSRIHVEIAQTSTSKLSPLKERDLVQSLVLQFLQHDGYIETARAFAEEIHGEKRALSLDPSAVIEDINVRDDEHATKRQRKSRLKEVTGRNTDYK